MREIERPVRNNNPAMEWGSDPIAAVLRDAGFEWVSFTPGASFRGLHDSLVNFLGNEQPQMLLCVHEEVAVSIAHGYAKVTGHPMAVALHSNVGLMHATMAIFNAWCDRVPIVLIGAQGPMDAPRRRAWVDWLHTTRDLGSLIRGYVKWDDQPASVEAALEAIMRARIIAATHPTAPVFVCLDAEFQERALTGEVELPKVSRFQPAPAPQPSPEMIRAAVQLLSVAANPVILMGRATTDIEAWQLRVKLAESLGARVLTSLRSGAAFPTRHPLHPHPPGLFVDEASAEMIRSADVILSLDWIDLGGTLRLVYGGKSPRATIIHCSADQYCHNGWSMDHQALPPVDLSLLATPEATVPLLVDQLKSQPRKPALSPAPKSRDYLSVVAPVEASRLNVEAFSAQVVETLSPHRPCYIRLPIGWPGRLCDFDHPLSYLGTDGGGGLGSGPGMGVGAALALRGSDRLPVAIMGDGEFMMGLTALWTAVHYKIPLLLIVANNRSFFNDELHQERMARQRSRPVENRWIGLRMADPPLDIAMLARGQGAEGIGPIEGTSELQKAFDKAIAIVSAGGVCVLDVMVTAEYDRATSSGVLRQTA